MIPGEDPKVKGGGGLPLTLDLSEVMGLETGMGDDSDFKHKIEFLREWCRVFEENRFFWPLDKTRLDKQEGQVLSFYVFMKQEHVYSLMKRIWNVPDEDIQWLREHDPLPMVAGSTALMHSYISKEGKGREELTSMLVPPKIGAEDKVEEEQPNTLVDRIRGRIGLK